jgi:multisubunit Na+/H+ antiporter MnhC subunit
MPKRSALILTAMLAAFCLLALAVMVMFAVDAATSVDVGCHG